jgi:hypothetical protein
MPCQMHIKNSSGHFHKCYFSVFKNMYFTFAFMMQTYRSMYQLDICLPGLHKSSSISTSLKLNLLYFSFIWSIFLCFSQYLSVHPCSQKKACLFPRKQSISKCCFIVFWMLIVLRICFGLSLICWSICLLCLILLRNCVFLIFLPSTTSL